MMLDLSRARLLLLRGEGGMALRAIDAVRTSLQAEFDAADEGVAAALTVLDEIRSAPLAPALPALGESRRELARLRGLPERAAPVDTATDADAMAAPTIPQEAVPAEAPAEEHLDVLPPGAVDSAAGDVAPAADEDSAGSTPDSLPQG